MIFPRAGTNMEAKSSRSIKKTIQFSYVLIITLMILPTIYSFSVSRTYTSQYDKIITNVSKANRLNQMVKIEISNEIWDIVAGKKLFSDGNQYEIIQNIRSGIEEMAVSTQLSENRQYLEVSSRALLTLEKYVNTLGSQIEQSAPVADNEIILEEVRGVASLIYDILQDFIVAEIESAAKTNDRIKISYSFLTLIQMIITVIVIGIAFFTLTSVSEKIRKPIMRLENLSSEIAAGNLEARAVKPYVKELDNLTQNLNIMAEKITDLLDENIKEQQNFQKAQMKALQAQITPHFLYNTFDTIIWLAETKRTEEVIEVTRAFSNFFRISLSKGHEWITVEQEIEHIKSYLTIQKIRYRDILDYSISVEDEMKDTSVLKLILQPLVENAIYHGIKNKRGRGILEVVVKKDNGRIYFSVADNGIGMSAEKVKSIYEELESKPDTELLKNVYGLFNVQKRLELYYNEKIELLIESEYGSGTVVSFNVPAEMNHV